MESLKRGRNSGTTMMNVVADFNLLIELANVMGVESVMDICTCILTKKPFTNDIMVTTEDLTKV